MSAIESRVQIVPPNGAQSDAHIENARKNRHGNGGRAFVGALDDFRLTRRVENKRRGGNAQQRQKLFYRHFVFHHFRILSILENPPFAVELTQG